MILQIIFLFISAYCIYDYYINDNGESLLYGILFIAVTIIL